MKKTTLLVLIFSIFLAISVNQNLVTGSGIADYGQCIWYGVGDINPDKGNSTSVFGDNHLNLAYDGEAKPLTSQIFLDLMEENCPLLLNDIRNDYDGEILTCCDEQMINIMVQSFTQIDIILGRCPSCVINLKSNFCYMSCHPRQSSFLLPTAYYKESVHTIEYYMSNVYANESYNSCDDVFYPELNTEAIYLFCGEYGSECTPQRLYEYLGASPFSPFLIEYRYYETTDPIEVEDLDGNSALLTPMNADCIPCNTEDPLLACACADCVEKCPPHPSPVKEDDPILIGEMRLLTFIMMMAWVVISIAIMIYFLKFYEPEKDEKRRKISANQKKSAKLEEFLVKKFTKMETHIAKHPLWVMLGSVILVVGLSIGNMWLEMTADPVELWSAPDSRTRQEKDYFDENFGPFYRTTMVIAVPVGFSSFEAEIEINSLGETSNRTFGPSLNEDFLLEFFNLQDEILKLNATIGGKTVQVNDVCIKPLSPKNDECMVQSIFNYWQNNVTYFLSQTENNSTKYLSWFHKCTRNPTYTTETESCLATYGGPILPYVVLGGFLEEDQTLNDSPDYDVSEALIITLLIKNYVDDDDLEPAMAWEEVFLDFMKSYNNPSMEFTFYAERSIEDEIIEEGKGDVSTITISYIIMFAYVTLALGSTTLSKTYFISSKMVVGLAGVLIVLFSVIASIGFYGYIGIQSTIFVVEVVPFLVLAIGVDNIFIMVQSVQRTTRDPEESVEEFVGRAVGKVAPSILISTISEALCFFIGALTNMPAVRSFALSASLALVVNFLLQMTCFVAIVALDAKREFARRYDILCCIKSSSEKKEEQEELLVKLFRDYFGPFLTHKITQMVVLIVFIGGFFISISFIPTLDIGLEQDIAFSDDSYLVAYFEMLGLYLSVGPPVYFVLKEGFDYTKVSEQNLICSSFGCQDDSVLTQILMASRTPDETYIATGASSWLEAYFSWISDTGDFTLVIPVPETACCRLDQDGNFINSSESVAEETVSTCLAKDQFYEAPYENRPLSDQFMFHLPDFLIDNTHDSRCPQAGHPAYGDAVEILGEERTNSSSVGANYFMAYHTLLKTSDDFTYSLEQAYELTDRLTEYLEKNSNTSVEVFPYTIHYVYYEQYLTLMEVTAIVLSLSVFGVIVVMLLLTAFDVLTTAINMLIISMIICDLLACMAGWGIQLNAVSLVNIVMAIGIAVEFCSHFTHAFNLAQIGTRRERTIATMTNTGTSILSGIAMTKLAGIIVLGFANSKLFRVYYFQMFLLMVAMGIAHGIILLPVITSLIGHPVNPYLPVDEETTLNIKDRKSSILEEKAVKNGHTPQNGIPNAAFASEDKF